MKKHFSIPGILIPLNMRRTLLVIIVCMLKSQRHPIFSFTTLGKGKKSAVLMAQWNLKTACGNVNFLKTNLENYLVLF